MAWSTPLTAVANTALNASQWNASVRDNLLETAAAKATVSGSIFVGTGTNTLAERLVQEHEVTASETTTSTTYTNLTTNGPILSSVTTGVKALVWISAMMQNTSANIAAWSSFEVTGATTSVSTNTRGIVINAASGDAFRVGATTLMALTAGANTFRMQYQVQSGTGTFQRRKLVVMAL